MAGSMILAFLESGSTVAGSSWDPPPGGSHWLFDRAAVPDVRYESWFGRRGGVVISFESVV